MSDHNPNSLPAVLLAHVCDAWTVTHNGAHVQAAIEIAVAFGVPFPAWLRQVLAASARAIRTQGSTSATVMRALWLSIRGGRSKTTLAQIEARDLAIIAMVDHFKRADRMSRSFTLPNGRVVAYGMAPKLRRDLEIDGVFAVVGRRFDLDAERVEGIVYTRTRDRM